MSRTKKILAVLALTAAAFTGVAGGLPSADSGASVAKIDGGGKW